MFVVQPLGCVYYPVVELPAWLQPICWALPPTYVFEGLRAVLIDHVLRFDLLAQGLALDAVLFALACVRLRPLAEKRAARRHAAADRRVMAARRADVALVRARPVRKPRQGARGHRSRAGRRRRTPRRRSPRAPRRARRRDRRVGALSLGVARRRQARPCARRFRRRSVAAASVSMSAPRPAASPTCCWRAARAMSSPSMSATTSCTRSCARDPRVTSLEGLDARAMTRAQLSEPPALIVMDASFISLGAGAAECALALRRRRRARRADQAAVRGRPRAAYKKGVVRDEKRARARSARKSRDGH